MQKLVAPCSMANGTKIVRRNHHIWICLRTKCGKKKGKKKGVTLNLNEFLADSPGGGSTYVVSKKSSSWADESAGDDADISTAYLDTDGPMTRMQLPTAPKSAQPVTVDYDKLPDKPPYTVYLGNIPFDCTEEEIIKFLTKCKVSNVRFPKDNDGRFKGFCYAEVDDMDSLLQALSLNDEFLRSRRVKVDLATQDNHSRDRNGDKYDRTQDDWRKGNDDNLDWGRGGDRVGRGNNAYDDQDWGRGRDRYDDGGRRGGFGNWDRRGQGSDRWGSDERRGGGPDDRRGGFSDRRGGRYDDRRGGGRDDRGGYEDRSDANDDWRGGGNDDRRDDQRGGGYDDRRGGGYDDRRGGYDDRRGGYDDRRGGGFGYDDRRNRGYDNRRGGYDDRRRGGYDDRRGGGYDDRRGGGFGYDDRRGGYDDRRGGYDDGRGGYDDRRGGYDDGRGGYDDRKGGHDDRGGYNSRKWEDDDGSGLGRYERKPEDSAMNGPRERKKLVLAKRSQPLEKDTSETRAASSSIFGGAKPVDTAAKEREIEERLRRKQEAEALERKREESEKDVIRREKPERTRTESETSAGGHEGRTRHSSSGSGRSGPRPVMIRRESERSNDEDAVFHKEDATSPTATTSPSEPTSPKSPKTFKEEPKIVMPAPPPKENAWAKRNDSVVSPVASVPPARIPSSSESPKESTPPRKEHTTSGDVHRKDTGRHQDDKERRRHSSDGRGSKPGVKKQQPEKKHEKQSTRKPPEMPKYEEPQPKDWTQRNMFSGLEEEDI